MKQGLKEYILFSSTKSAERVNNMLTWCGIKYKQVKGSYKGELEDAWIINTNNVSKYRDILEYIVDEQECLLHLGVCDARDRRPATLIYNKDIDKDPVYLGLMRQVSKEYALKQESWTYDYQNDAYFVAEGD